MRFDARSAPLALVLGLGAGEAWAQAGEPQTPHLRFEHGVRSILEDAQGNFWFGSWNEGVARFDGECLTYFTVEDGLSDNQVRSIYEDGRGTIWFEGGSGVSRFDGERIVPDMDRAYGAEDAWRLEPGDLWFKGDEAHGYNNLERQPGVYRYDGDRFAYLAFPLPAPRARDEAYSVTGFSRAARGAVWFSMYGAVIGYDGETFTLFDNDRLGLTEETGFLHARCVLEDTRGRVWIGNNGIGVILIEGDNVVHFTQAQGVGRRDHRAGGGRAPQPGDAPDGAPSLHRVFSIGEDRLGHIWFGTIEQGAWRFDGETLTRFGADDGLASADILGIYRDRRGDLWLGGASPTGVYKFNGESVDRVH